MSGQPITASPLTWPNGWKRSDPRHRQRARFGKKGDRWGLRQITIAEAVDFTLDQLRMMAVHGEDVIISTDHETIQQLAEKVRRLERLVQSRNAARSGGGGE